MLLSAAKPRDARNGNVRTRAAAPGTRAGRVGLALAALMLGLAGQPVLAQTGGKPDQSQTAPPPGGGPQALRAKLNQETLVIAASRPGTSYMAMAADLAAAVGVNGGLRLLPVAADGGVANLQDLLFLRSVDLAIVPANVLAHARASNALGAGVAHKIAYLTALYNEGVHVIAGRDIGAITDLRGRTVAVPAGDGTARFTADDIFKRLGIAVETVAMEPTEALDEVRDGKIAAVLLVGGKPLAQVAALPKDGSLRLLSLPFQTVPGEGYVPAVFVAEDYPALIPPGAIVETVAVGAVLMASKGGEEARRIARHTPALLAAIGTLAGSEAHPRWRDVNLGAVLPGWFRVEAAEKWLSEAFQQRKQQLKGVSEPPRIVRPVKSTALTTARPKTQKKLFDEFEAWASQSAAVDEPGPE